jgi:hypothetical protein
MTDLPNLEDAPELDDWIAVESPYGVCLVGTVTGHPLLPDGVVRTSLLVAIADDRTWARTLNRYYRLKSALDLPSMQ